MLSWVCEILCELDAIELDVLSRPPELDRAVEAAVLVVEPLDEVTSIGELELRDVPLVLVAKVLDVDSLLSVWPIDVLLLATGNVSKCLHHVEDLLPYLRGPSTAWKTTCYHRKGSRCQRAYLC